MEARGTLTSKGQITIPQPVRAMLGLKAGDAVIFTGDEGHMEIQKDIGNAHKWSMSGALDRSGRNTPSVSIEDMDVAIAKGAAQGLENQ